ncbi:MAG: fumarylacetoacetate hydrolase family protein [Rhodobiaceae bacterium]|nr:fumarylacetoacetate hydrolase family protein [Rhodobiaceae bacterium]
MSGSPHYVFAPPPQVALPVAGSDKLFPVRRIYCVGRNYAEHAVEMGSDPNAEPPFFFQKNPDNLDISGTFPYPAASSDVHHEVELVVALAKGGTDIAVEDADACVFGYAVGIDMTRRDLQGAAKKTGRPWEVGKAFERSAPVGPLFPAAGVGPLAGRTITMAVNGEVRQRGSLDDMIWKVPQQIAYLSSLFALAPGDLIFTGTPAGVGPVQPGDVMVAEVSDLDRLEVTVTPRG